MESLNNSNGTPIDALEGWTGFDMRSLVYVMLSMFVVLGTVGNAMVIFVYRNKKHKLATTVFILTLAYIDVFTCTIVIPFTMVMEHLEFYVHVDFVCKSYMFLITSNVPFSAFIMTAIAVDRYFCICHPLTSILNVRRAKFTIAILGFFAVLLGLLTSLNYGTWPDDNSQKVNSNDDLRQQLSEFTEEGLRFELNGTSYNHTNTDAVVLREILSKPQQYEGAAGAGQTRALCQPNRNIFPLTFFELYQKVYSSVFVVSIIIVMVLYTFICRSLSRRRKNKTKSRRQSLSISMDRSRMAQTSVILTKGTIQTVSFDSPDLSQGRRDGIRERIRDKMFVANFRTATMLFAVTFIFVLVFLPAWLMSHRVLEYNIVIFYMYFFYNVANPAVYAFTNSAFRRDLKVIFDRKVRQRLRTLSKL